MYKIIDISWERANLNIKLNKSINDNCYLIYNNNKIKINTKENKIIINITNTPEGKSLEAGEYYILIDDEKLKIDLSILKILDDKSRIFKYKNNIYAMLVDFNIKDNTFYINVDYMIKNKNYKRNISIKEGNNLKDYFLFFIKILLIFFVNIFYKLLNLFSSNKNILFLTENANKLNGNLEILYKKFNTMGNFNIKILAYDKSSNKSIKNYINEVIKISTCNIIIVDNYVSLLNIINISKKQKIIQLWHAGVGFKAVGYARFGKDSGPHPFKSSHRKYDKVFVDSDELIDIYYEVFGCKKKNIIATGMPRLDGYLDKDKIDSTVKKLEDNMPNIKNKKIILFSPTYRGESIETAYYDYNSIDLNQIYNYCEKNKFVFLIKMHPFIKEKINISKEYENVIIDVSDCDINELIYITDIMITDYSSCAYEYSFFNRPLIFYRYDKEIYEYERGIHTLDIFNDKQYEVKTFDDLMKTLNNLKNIKIEDRFANIKKHNNESCDIIITNILQGEKK